MRTLFCFLLLGCTFASATDLTISQEDDSGKIDADLECIAESGGNEDYDNDHVQKFSPSHSGSNSYQYGSASGSAQQGQASSNYGNGSGGKVGIKNYRQGDAKKFITGAKIDLDPAATVVVAGSGVEAQSYAEFRSTYKTEYESITGDGSVSGGNQIRAKMTISWSESNNTGELEGGARIYAKASSDGKSWVQAIWNESNNWWVITWSYYNSAGTLKTGNQLVTNRSFNKTITTYERMSGTGTVYVENLMDDNSFDALHLLQVTSGFHAGTASGKTEVELRILDDPDDTGS